MQETQLTPIVKPSHSGQLIFFGAPATYIQTEGIKYSGSKLKLLPHILSIVQSLPVRKSI